MKRSDLAHVLRAASRIVEGDMLVIGSQAIHGAIDEAELPELTMLSRERGYGRVARGLARARRPLR